VVTHLHPDHLGLAAWLQGRTGVPVWMTQAEYATAHLWLHEVGGYAAEALYAALRAHGLEGPRLAELERRGNTYRSGAPELPSTYRPIFDGETLAIGAGHWRVVCGHGHSPEHASLHEAGAEVLISGDMLLPRITTNISAPVVAPGSDTLGLYLASLERLEALPGNPLVLPSHGLPFRGLRARVAQLREHHARRCDLLRAACGRGSRSAASLLPVLFERDIEDPFQTLFAMGECIAHLIHLEHEGSLVREETGGAIRFTGR
jgi:glyoxylase-like metal-dependent hydrolase (beta-lactamase superfamily II)